MTMRLISFRSALSTLILLTLFWQGDTAYGASAPVSNESAIKQIPIIDVPQTAESIEKVNKLQAEGEKFFDQNVMDKALAKWQEAYGMSIEMKYTEGEGRALTNMARVYLDHGDWIKAKYLGENAADVLGGLSDSKVLAHARVALAQAYFGLGNNKAAGDQLQAAIRTFTGEEGADSLEAGKLLTLAGQLLIRYGKLKEAVQFLQQAANYYTQANDTVNAVRNHLAVSAMLEQLGLYVASLEESTKAVTVARNSKDEDNGQTLVAALSSQGNGQYCLCEFANAAKTYEQALKIARNLGPHQLTRLAAANLELGYAYCLSGMGDLERAKQIFERVIDVFKSSNSATGEAQALNGLGNVEEAFGMRSKAVQTFSRALDLQSIIRPPKAKFNIAVLQNLACAESRCGLNRDARGHLEAALGLLKKTKDQLLQARTYSSLAEVYYKLADAAQTEAMVQKAIEVATAINDDASLWRNYLVLAKLRLAAGDKGAAKEALISAFSFFRSPQAGAFVLPERLYFPSTREDCGQELVAMAVREGMTEQALLAAEQLKDESFCNIWLKRGAAVKPEDRDVYTDLVTQRAHLYAAETYDVVPSTLVKEWQNWLGRFRTLIMQNRSLAKMIAPLPVRVADIVKVAQANKLTLVEYLIGADSSLVFTIDASGRISSTVLPIGRKDFVSQVAILLSSLNATASEGAVGLQRDRSLLKNLHNELIPHSVQPFIPQNSDQTIVIIPDSVLFNLPFAALVDDQGKYFLENHTLTLSSSIGALLDASMHGSAFDNSLVMAGTNGDTGETGSIAGIFQAEVITKLSSKDADLTALREDIRGKSIIHVASRFTLLPSDPFDSAFSLSGIDGSTDKVTGDTLFGSNINSDLIVFSNASVDAKDDIAIKLLSYGLNYAEARNLLTSLWQAPEPGRTDELLEFYKNIQAGLSKAQSLRKAELMALLKDPNPRAWASFQLLGVGN